MDKEKIIVIGVDGGSWNLLDEWIEEEELPNIQKIKSKGFSGELSSTYPYVTFPAWKTYSTGRNPAKFDVYYWCKFDQKNGDLDFANSLDFKSKELWDYLSDADFTSGVINMPSTFPPKEIDGFMVSGTLASEEDDYTYPKELKKSLSQDGYRVNPASEKGSEEWLEEVRELFEKRTDLALDKLEEVDFMHLTYFFTDNVQHNFWDSEETLEVWKAVDKQIGRILEEDVNIILMSDHGFQPLDKFFFANSWLEEKGYLQRNKDFGDKVQKTGLNRDKIYTAVKYLGLENIARKLIPKSIRRKIPREDGFVEETDMTPKIDFENSKAFALSEGPLYIIEDNVENKEKLKKEITDKLEAFKDGKIVKEVIDGNKIYSGTFEDSAPDLFLDQASGIEIRMDISNKIISKDKGGSSWIANHRQQGIYSFYGPDFDEGKENINIYDLMPTILSYYGVQIPPDVDGEARTEIFGEVSETKLDKTIENLDI